MKKYKEEQEGYTKPHCGNPPHCGCPPNEENGCLFLLWKIVFSLFIPYLKIRSAFNPNPIIALSNQKKKIAYISVYGIPCGISTYNEQLISELSNFADIRVFAEYADDNKSEKIDGDPDFVYRCWSRNEHPKLKLLNMVNDWSPDLVHIGHEYGFFYKAHLFTSLVSWFRSRNIPVVATMHSIYDHQDKTVQEAAGQHIIAHTKEGRSCLAKKGIAVDKISIIPHGTNILDGTPEDPKLLNNLWNTWYNDHTIFQPGFLFDYKGHMRMLSVIAQLKNKYPDIHYVVQGSENPKNKSEHETLYKKMINKCQELDIESNVTINRGFISEQALLSYIRTCKICVLPYSNHPAHDVRSSSGIARLIIGTETPLVASKVHLFDDINNVSFKVKNDEELYDTIDQIFSEADYGKSLNENRVEFLRKTSWKNVANQHEKLYKKILNNRKHN